jgi:hypothetical protein
MTDDNSGDANVLVEQRLGQLGLEVKLDKQFAERSGRVPGWQSEGLVHQSRGRKLK